MKNYFKLAWISVVILLICFVFAMLGIFIKIAIFQYIAAGLFSILFLMELYALFIGLLFPIMKDLFLVADKLDKDRVKRKT